MATILRMSSGFATRLASSLLATLALGAPAWPQGEGSVRLVVQSSPLAAFAYYDAADVWPALKVGDRLELRREAGNPHDANAVAVEWRGRKLGYVPRRENATLAWALDRGDRLRARISLLRSHPNPARRLEFEVYAE